MRRGRDEGAGRGQRQAHPGHPGAGRQVGAVQGEARRGRRGAGLPHRRQGGRRRRRRHRVPRVGQGDQRLPDRGAQGRAQPGRRGGVRRLRASPPAEIRCSPTQGSSSPEQAIPLAGAAGPGDPRDRRAGVPGAAPGRAAGPGALVDAARSGWPTRRILAALRLSLETATLATAGEPGARRTAGLGAGPHRPARPRGSSGRWSPCRWCCRRWSAAWRCCWSSAATGCSAAGSTRTSGSRCRSPPPAWWSPRRSWRCRSW